MLENIEGSIQRNWQHRVHMMKKNKTKTQHDMCWMPHYTNNVNKTRVLLQITGDKDKSNIVFIIANQHQISIKHFD